MKSLQASPEGRKLIKQAREDSGWTVENVTPLVLIGTYLYPQDSWEWEEPYPKYHSPGTWKSFLAGGRIRAKTFKNFCWVLALDWRIVMDVNTIIEWDDEQNTSSFYGRKHELNYLEEKVINKCCQLLLVLGIGGIGKTTLVFEFANNFQNDFDFSIEISLKNSPPFNLIADKLLNTLNTVSGNNLRDLPDDIYFKISLIISYLKEWRCLIVLDNFDGIFDETYPKESRYLDGYHSYDHFIQKIAQDNHKSCVIITSQREPEEIFSILNNKVQRIKLKGLNNEDAKRIISEERLEISPLEVDDIVEHYGGHPLVLKIVSAGIRNYFEGRAAPFMNLLKQGIFPFNELDINVFIERQIERITLQEKEIIYWLAINREPISLETLKSDLDLRYSNIDLRQSLDSLTKHILIDYDNYFVGLHPVIQKYITSRIVNKVCDEVLTGRIESLEILKNYALVKAQSEEYIRKAQYRLIVRPIINQLLSRLGTKEAVEERLENIKRDIQQNVINLFSSCNKEETNNHVQNQLEIYAIKENGYAVGNILNFFRYLKKANLSGMDFSNLPIVQGYLQGVNLTNTDFSHSKFTKCSFTKTLGSILSLSFSPDGNLLATGDSDGNINLWDVSSEKCLLTFHKSHSNWIMSVAFSADGNLLATGDSDGNINLWNVSTGKHLTAFNHNAWIMSVAFSSNGRHLVSGGADSVINLWNVEDVENIQLVKRLEGHQGRVWSVSFSPDNTKIVSGSDDGTIRLWNVRSKSCIRVLSGHRGWVTSVAFSPDSKTIASGSTDRTVKIWDTKSKNYLQSFEKHQHWIASVAFSFDGSMVASSSEDRTVKIWEIDKDNPNREYQPCLFTLRGYTSRIWDIAFNPVNRTLAVGCDDRVLTLWDVDKGLCTRKIQGYPQWVMSIDGSHNGEKIVSAHENKTIKLWNISTKENKILKGHTGRIWSACLSPDLKQIASASDDQTVRIWESESGRCVKVFRGHISIVFTVAFSPNGRLLASAGEDKVVIIWNITTQQKHTLPLRGHSGRIRSVTFSPDGQFLASGSEDGSIRIWNSETGEHINTFEETNDEIFSISFSPHTKFIASVGSAKKIKIWSIENPQKVSEFVELHTGRIRSVAFSENGKLLATGSEDKTVKIWNITGECINTLVGHTDTVRSVSFTSEDEEIVSGSHDGTIRIWSVCNSYQHILGDDLPYRDAKLLEVKGLTESEYNSLTSLGAIV